jgi:regulator of RNase E activity RraA
VPVCVGGQIVQPGDMVVGDEDGIVTFAQAEAPRLLEAVAQTERFEATIKAEIANGNAQQSWLTKAFAPHGL